MESFYMEGFFMNGSSSSTYNREAVVQYAEKWWNSYNSAFPIFEVDCTNFVSQCVYAGGAPMRGEPVSYRGWRFSGDQWRLSWYISLIFFCFIIVFYNV